MEILKQRYPDIGFFLSFFPYEKTKLPKNPKPLLEWLGHQKLEEIDVLYIVGLIGYSLPEPLEKWLKEKKERALVFVEEQLGAFVVFSENELLLNPQIHFVYAQEGAIDVLAEDFPTDRLAIFEGKPFDALGLKRRSAALSALYSDILYSHKIVENVLTHFQRLQGCFDARGGSFKNIPAIICGAGPSLEKSFPLLRQASNLALIFAGGSAITSLTRNSIRPHFAMALDPNEEEFDRLKQSTYFEGPFLFAPRLQRNVFATVNGPFGYLKSDTGGLVESWLEKRLGLEGDSIGPDLGPEAFSVTTIAISYAFALGCNPIILAGVDLAYTGGKRYAQGIQADISSREDPRALEKILIKKDIHGNEVETLLKWVMESECISAFAKAHPQTRFINATEGGIGFEGIENISLQSALHGTTPRDLAGEIHQWIQASPLKCNHEKIPSVLDELEESLKRCDGLCSEILQELEKGRETGKLVLLKSDFVDEIAYSAILEGIDLALNRILFRYYPHLDSAKGKWEREVAKFKELKAQISRFKMVFHKRANCFT